MGLGLAVSYGIIEAHGGDIEVKSKVGEGTTFTVSLPLEQPAAAPAEPPLPAAGAARNEVPVRGRDRRRWSARRSRRCRERRGGRVRRVRCASMELPGVEFAFDAERAAVRLDPGAGDAARGAARRTPRSCWRSPERDLFIPVLTFVFGQAQLGGRVARGLAGAPAAGILRARRPTARSFWSAR